MSSSEFAKRQLKKHGWSEGSGLGKLEDGRSEPVKVSLKMDKTGVGHDPGKEFTDHWWLRVFNEAAKKIGKNQTIEATSDSEQKKKMHSKKNFYSNFVKSSVLTNGIEEKHKDSGSSSEDEKNEVKPTNLPTLNDIHEFCGGATGHKAARFGIKMNGKLARIAEQDKLFQEKLRKDERPPSETITELAASSCVHDVTEQEQLSAVGCPEQDRDNICEDGSKKRKKKRKKDKVKKHSDDARIGHDFTDGQDEMSKASEFSYKKDKMKRKNKKKKHKENDDQKLHEQCEISETKESRRKRRKKDLEIFDHDDMIGNNESEIKTNISNVEALAPHEVADEFKDTNSSIKKKKKKKNK